MPLEICPSCGSAYKSLRQHIQIVRRCAPNYMSDDCDVTVTGGVPQYVGDNGNTAMATSILHKVGDSTTNGTSRRMNPKRKAKQVHTTYNVRRKVVQQNRFKEIQHKDLSLGVDQHVGQDALNQNMVGDFTNCDDDNSLFPAIGTGKFGGW
jgi:hypothetical protein